MTVVIAWGAVLVYPHIAGLVDYKPRLDRLFEALHRDPIFSDALRQQNVAFAAKDEAWALSLDQAWNAERLRGDPLQRAVMETPVSEHLRQIVAESGGLISHAFLIDAKGRMAAEPFPSFNFWQFDKPKFHYTLPLGAGARDVSWLQLSWDGSHPVCWRAETMVDLELGKPIRSSCARGQLLGSRIFRLPRATYSHKGRAGDQQVDFKSEQISCAGGGRERGANLPLMTRWAICDVSLAWPASRASTPRAAGQPNRPRQ